MGAEGTIQGMLCDGYDDEDWYDFTLPAYHGLWADQIGQRMKVQNI